MKGSVKWIVLSSVIGLLVAVLFVFFPPDGSGKRVKVNSREQYVSDSLHFEKLIHTGDSIYAIRNKMNNISESLIYFDSAIYVSRKMKDDRLNARSHFYIGNVYNAWNKKPEKTIYHYNKALEIVRKYPESRMDYYTYSYILAHAYDFEKFGDSLKCITILKEVLTQLSKESDSVKRRIDVLPDFAWIASNINNYELAAKFINDEVQFPVRNNPNTNNYLDHYYITKARIDILGNGKQDSPYLDSIAIAADKCSNNFDKQYYLFSLIKLYVKTGNFKKAFEIRELTLGLNESINKGEITSLLKANNLLKELNNSNLNKEKVSSKLKFAYLLIALAILAMLVLVIVFRLIYLQRLRKQAEKESHLKSQFTKQLFETIESDRKRIASDLHDSVGNELITLKRSVNADQNELKDKIDQLIDTIRSISRNLHPSLFERIGLRITLEQLVERIQYSDHFMLTAEINYDKGLSPMTELQVYRIIQEAITNMMKHANAIAGKISIDEKPSSVVIVIKDNGNGFDVERTLQNPKTFGIHNIIERVQAISGTVVIKSDSSGTQLNIEIPKNAS